MNGIINIHKPKGPTSFQMVGLVKRLTGVKKAGHAGTLDPAASGVLPVCLGKATRISEYVMEGSKTYLAEVEFGRTTDTYDSEGTITSESDPSGITLEHISAALPSFRGDIEQTPPAYSALKFQGKPYYELARAGIELDIKSRPVTIYSLEITDWKPPVVTLEITCSKGTYIRSLAYDIGQALGCGGYMKSLVRSRYGIFTLDNAVTPEGLEIARQQGDWEKLVSPVDSVLQHIPAVSTDEDGGRDLKNGKSLTQDRLTEITAEHTEDSRRRIYIDGTLFAGILRFDKESGAWHPEKVFL